MKRYIVATKETSKDAQTLYDFLNLDLKDACENVIKSETTVDLGKEYNIDIEDLYDRCKQAIEALTKDYEVV